MKAIIQRVRSSRVEIDDKTYSQTGPGLCILLGVGKADKEEQAACLAQKIANLRIFEDTSGKMNLSLLQIQGEAMVVSNFTLYANARRGRRPEFLQAAPPQQAEQLYLYFISALEKEGVHEVQTGSFGADMLLKIENDGPVTIILDTDELMC